MGAFAPIYAGRMPGNMVCWCTMEAERVGRLFGFVGATVAVSVFTFFIAPLSVRAAFGVSPPFIHASHLSPGAKYSKTIYLVQDHPSEDLKVIAELSFPPKVQKWISLDTGFSFVIPKGVRQFPVTVSIAVPKEEKLAAYNGTLRFKTAPADQGLEGGQVAIALGALVNIDIVVGNEVYHKYRANIDLLDIEEGWSPRVRVRFFNEGNVAESFDRAVYRLYDEFRAISIAFAQKTSGFPLVPAFTTKEFVVEFPLQNLYLAVGNYWGEVQFFKNDKVVASNATVFRVLPKGTLQKGEGSAASSDFLFYLLFGILAVVVAVFVGLLRMKLTRSRKKKKLSHS
ncbi:hypothetical protein D6779_01755 [Candidatus Parcubacteria bacterium]|nr:MAG: hypothetical protein D6779_01755 [Candidatus Parcubacteria bacterium]